MAAMRLNRLAQGDHFIGAGRICLKDDEDAVHLTCDSQSGLRSVERWGIDNDEPGRAPDLLPPVWPCAQLYALSLAHTLIAKAGHEETRALDGVHRQKTFLLTFLATTRQRRGHRIDRKCTKRSIKGTPRFSDIAGEALLERPEDRVLAKTKIDKPGWP